MAAVPNPKRSLEIPTSQSAEFVPVDFDELAPAEYLPIAELLRDEQAPVKFWVRLIEEIWRLGKWTLALEIAHMGIVGEFWSEGRGRGREQRGLEELTFWNSMLQHLSPDLDLRGNSCRSFAC